MNLLKECSFVGISREGITGSVKGGELTEQLSNGKLANKEHSMTLVTARWQQTCLSLILHSKQLHTKRVSDNTHNICFVT